MHFKHINSAGELVNSWDAGLVTLTDGNKVMQLRQTGLAGGKLTDSSLLNTGLGYMVDAGANGCNPASVKESDYAPKVLELTAKIPDSVKVTYAMPELDSEGRLTGNFVTIYESTMAEVRAVAKSIASWTPSARIIAELPTPPAHLLTAGKGKSKTRGVAVPLEWDSEPEPVAKTGKK